MSKIDKFIEQIENLNTKNACIIYHANCADGSGAAYSLWKKLGDNPIYFSYEYGQKTDVLFEVVKGKDVVFVDVTMKRFDLLKVKELAKSLTVIDHHQSAFDNIGDLDCCFFDMKHSGAMLAWKIAHPNTEPPKFISLIEDGDLWNFKYSETKWFYSGFNTFKNLHFKEFTFLEDENKLKNIIAEGKVLREEYDRKVNDFVRKAEPVRFMGHDIYMVECSRDYASEVGNKLALKTNSFSICHSQKDDNYKISLRSVPEMDISLIASLFYGGGHPNASAFVTPTKEVFLDILNNNPETQIPSKEEIKHLNEELLKKSVSLNKL